MTYYVASWAMLTASSVAFGWAAVRPRTAGVPLVAAGIVNTAAVSCMLIQAAL